MGPRDPATDVRAFLRSLEQFGVKLGLDQIRALLAALGHPDRAFPSVIVAGTNGKGSVVAMVERGLRAAGYRTGRYTSPHLIDLEERVALDGRSVSRETFDAAAVRVQAASATLTHPPSFFEATTAVALETFRQAAVDVAVLEVGLGGRLDATNAVTPVGAAITRVDFDHELMLGDSLEAIAREKAGVVRPGCFVVLAANPPEVEAAVEDACRQVRARLVAVSRQLTVETHRTGERDLVDVTTSRGVHRDLALALPGRHQVGNAAVAIALLEELGATSRFDVPASAVRTGVEQAEWPGRLERVRVGGVDVLLDGAHNPSGAAALVAHLRETFGRPLPMVVGLMQDKPAPAMIEALAPAASAFVFTAPDSPRAARPETLLDVARRVAPAVPAASTDDPRKALTLASRLAGPVVVAGSLYLVGQVRRDRS